MTVRTRIAPSPTGDPHVGTAYIALFNYCFAKQHGGEFLLRIEDTDQTRSTKESEDAILEALRWVGLSWDEGPDVGGPKGPYRQSERTALYVEHAQKLLDSGHAFYSFITSDELTALRAAQKERGDSFIGYRGDQDLALTPDEIQAKLDAGVPHTIRLKIPDGEVVVVHDRLRDDIEISSDTFDAQVLIKEDGFPTYHLANVVDDHHMGITHVIRGEEWISSTPKHVLLYQAFGWEPPEFIHMPLLRNLDKSKLSKRKNPTSILYYERAGVLPEALLNFLGTMGWSMPDGAEKFTLDEMVASFDIDRISLGGPVFDGKKLNALNGDYIRELDLDDLAARVAGWMFNPERLKPILAMLQKRMDSFTDMHSYAEHFFTLTPEYEADALAHKKLDDDQVLRVLLFGQWRLEEIRSWNATTLYEEVKLLATAMGIKLGPFCAPHYVAMSGRASASPLFDSWEALGPDISRARIRVAVERKNGQPLGKKATGRLQKEYRVVRAKIEELRAERG